MRESDTPLIKLRMEDFQQRLSEKQQTDALCILAGVAAFGSTLAVSTWTQGRILGISTGTPGPTPTLAGMATVCVASWASHQAALLTHQYLATKKLPSWTEWRERQRAYRRQDCWETRYFKVPLHTLRICTIGLVAFKLLGGRFWAIAPSSYTHLGSFARTRWSLPAGKSYATAAQRAKIERLGRMAGCHTCGSHKLFSLSSSARFVGDHMPPKSVAEQMNRTWYRRYLVGPVKFRFFPQCVSCSQKQGSILSKATQELRSFRGGIRVPQLHNAGGGRNAYFHGFKFRINHLTGGLLGGLAVVGVSPDDLEDENRSRYASLQQRLTQSIQKSCQRVANALNLR